jgi:hypothetical protein
MIISILILETNESMLTDLYHLANDRILPSLIRDVSVDGAGILFIDWMAQIFIAPSIQALGDTWWNLLFMKQVLFVSDDIANNILPHVEIEMTIDKNLHVRYFLIFENLPLVSDWRIAHCFLQVIFTFYEGSKVGEE